MCLSGFWRGRALFTNGVSTKGRSPKTFQNICFWLSVFLKRRVSRGDFSKSSQGTKRFRAHFTFNIKFTEVIWSGDGVSARCNLDLTQIKHSDVGELFGFVQNANRWVWFRCCCRYRRFGNNRICDKVKAFCFAFFRSKRSTPSQTLVFHPISNK